MDRRDLITGGKAGELLRKSLDPERQGDDSQLPGPLFPGPAGEPEVPLQHFAFRAMGSGCQIFLPDRMYPNAGAAVVAGIAGMERLEQELSIYRIDSDLSRINQLARRKAVPVSGSIAHLLALSLAWNQETGGTYDPAMGPLTNLWGFRQRKPVLPPADEIDRVLQIAGVRNVVWDPADQTVRLLHPEAEIDFNGIGKGYGLELFAEGLRRQGVGCWILHAGQSSVVAGDPLPGESGWLVGISDPVIPGRRLAGIRLANQSLGTSGSARQVLVSGGNRYGHVLDPRTGWPAQHWLSATVVHPSPTTCDVLSTALFVMSLEELTRFTAERPDVKCLMVAQESDGACRCEAFNFAPGEIVES